MSHKNRKTRSLYIWHRYVGIAVSLLAIVLSVTGIMLNHTDRLELDKQQIESEWLLDWYGIQAPDNITSFKSGNNRITLLEDRLYWNHMRLQGHYTNLSGLLAFPHFFAVAADGKIILLTREGELIEQLGGLQGVPSGIKRMGTLENGAVVIDAAHGLYLTNQDFLKWQKTETNKAVNWIAASSLSASLKQQLSTLFRSSELPMERVILDLHSGRLFGAWGPLVMDIAAVLLIFLAVTGIWLWLKQLVRRQQRRKKKAAL